MESELAEYRPGGEPMLKWVQTDSISLAAELCCGAFGRKEIYLGCILVDLCNAVSLAFALRWPCLTWPAWTAF